LIYTAKEFKFNTLATVLHPKVKAALIGRLRKHRAQGREFKLTILTNSKESHQWLRISKAWKAGLRDLHDLMKEGAQVYSFTPTKEVTFLHRKLIVALMPVQKSDLHLKDSAILGSYNLTEDPGRKDGLGHR
jgi:hypothetical protein